MSLGAVRGFTIFLIGLNLALSGLTLIHGGLPLNFLLVGWFLRRAVDEATRAV